MFMALGGPDPNQVGPVDKPTTPADAPKTPEGTPTARGWMLFPTGSVQAAPTVEGKALKVAIVDADGTDWHLRLAYDANVVNRQVYELRFRAKADAPRTMAVASEVGANNVWPGLFRRVNLTADWQTFARRFVAQNAVDGQNILPEFWIGDKNGTVWLSDVVLTPLPAGSSLLPPVTDAAAWELTDSTVQVQPGGWPPGVGGPMTPTAAVDAAPATPGTAPAAVKPAEPLTKVTTEDNALRFELHSRPASYFAAWQGHAALKENAIYTLSFRAKADPPREMPLRGDVEAPGTPPEGLDAKVKVPRDWKTFTVTFTTKTGSKENHIAPQFVVGSQLGTLWLSDVTLVEGAITPPPSTNADTPAAPTSVVTAPAPKPSAGEIALTGTVTSVRASARSLILAVTAVITPDGKTTQLPASRPKTILVNADTSFVGAGGAAKALTDLQSGTAVRVLGRDSGSGKPLTARTISLTGP